MTFETPLDILKKAHSSVLFDNIVYIARCHETGASFNERQKFCAEIDLLYAGWRKIEDIDAAGWYRYFYCMPDKLWQKILTWNRTLNHLEKPPSISKIQTLGEACQLYVWCHAKGLF